MIGRHGHEADARVRRQRLLRLGAPAGAAHGSGGLERALRTVLGGAPARPPRSLTVAGRTDRGVHAWGQVASYLHEALDPLRLIMEHAQDDRRGGSRRSRCTEELSTPRRDAQRRPHVLLPPCSRDARDSVFERNTSFWVTGELDRELLVASARSCCTRQARSFTAFTPSETEHSWFQCNVSRGRVAYRWRPAVSFWSRRTLFLRHMNRVLRRHDARRGLGADELRAVRGAAAGPPARGGRAHGAGMAWRWRR